MNKKYIIVVLSLFFYKISYAQPQWKFYIAFEDATGARDTIWLIWDTTAHMTLPVDTTLGEGREQMNLNNFNVYAYNFNIDSTKTIAFPYSIYPILETEIYSFNYSYPIQISWDTSLFHAPYLPFQQGNILTACITNDYFYFVNNDPFSECYNMLIDNHAEAPYFNWGSQDHFPLFINFDGHGVNIESISNDNILSVFPNPVYNSFSITSEVPVKSYSIYNFFGHQIFTNNSSDYFNLQEIELVNIDHLANGVYLLEIETISNLKYYEKIYKVN